MWAPHKKELKMKFLLKFLDGILDDDEYSKRKELADWAIFI